jgi:hypothetical protein
MVLKRRAVGKHSYGRLDRPETAVSEITEKRYKPIPLLHDTALFDLRLELPHVDDIETMNSMRVVRTGNTGNTGDCLAQSNTRQNGSTHKRPTRARVTGYSP